MKLSRWRLVGLSAMSLLVLLPSESFAYPVQINGAGWFDEVRWGACATWIQPEGAFYRWTDVCAVTYDLDGDSDIDTRKAFVAWSMCEHDGSSPGGLCGCAGGSFCGSAGKPAEAILTASEVNVDYEGGTATIHADVGPCRLDVEWTSDADQKVRDTNELPAVSYGVYPPKTYVWLDQRSTLYRWRESSFVGSACPVAQVSGMPDIATIFELIYYSHTYSVRIDPTDLDPIA